MPWDKPWLHLKPPKHECALSAIVGPDSGNHQPRRNKKKGKKNCKGGNRNENANSNDKNARNAGGTSILNVRLSFFANCVRITTSLTCALIWKTPQGS